MKLTKRAVDALVYTRKSGAQCAWDDELVGFGVRVDPTGRKFFVVNDRADGCQRFFTLGKVGERTVHEARTKAMEVLAAARRGDDPSGHRIAYRRAPTMKDLAERYLREHARWRWNDPAKARPCWQRAAPDPLRTWIVLLCQIGASSLAFVR